MTKSWGFSLLLHATLVTVVVVYDPTGMTHKPAPPSAPEAGGNSASTGGSASASDPSATIDSTLAGRLRRVRQLGNDVIRARNRRALHLDELNQRMRASLPDLLDSSFARAREMRERAADAAIKAAEQLARSRSAWHETDSLTAANQMERAREKASAALRSAQSAENNRATSAFQLGQNRQQLDELSRTISWLGSDSLDRMMVAVRQDDVSQSAALAGLEAATQENVEKNRVASDKVERAAARRFPQSVTGNLDRWFLSRSLRDLKRTPVVQAALDSLANAGRATLARLDSLGALAQREAALGHVADTSLGQLSLDVENISPGLNRDSLWMNALGAEARMDSVYREARAAEEALMRRVPYRRADREMRMLTGFLAKKARALERARDSARATTSLPPQEVSSSSFNDLVAMLDSMARKPTWDTTKKDTTPPPEPRYIRGPQVDTIEMHLNISEDSLKAIVKRMNAITDTFYVDGKSSARYKDTMNIPYKLSAKDLAMLQRVFPPDTAQKSRGIRDTTTSLPASSCSLARPGQISFRLFPNIKVVGRGGGMCTRPILFNAPSLNGGGEGTPSRSILPQSIARSEGSMSASLDRMVSGLTRMRQTLNAGDAGIGNALGSAAALQRSASGFANLKELAKMSLAESGTSEDVSEHMQKALGLPRADDPGGSGSTSRTAPSLDGFTGAAGCRLSPNGKPAQWFYIPGWYVLGPFPNPKRVNIAKAFPPEFGIDLDASYRGAGETPIRWEYSSSATFTPYAENLPEYTIYYYFTRVWSDKPTNVWVAIGSDDRSDVWINDLPVWRSRDELKGWTINEGFRKVFLKQGENTILVRLENGYLSGCFSLLVCTTRS